MKYIIGFGRTGEAVAEYLLLKKLPFIVWDDNHNLQHKAILVGCQVVSPNKVNWLEIEELILSPGIPTQFPSAHNAVQFAKKYHIPFRGDIDFWAETLKFNNCRFVGITGTNGKSTTHALVDHILHMSNKPHVSAGNSGVPVFKHTNLPEGCVVNLEMSSFQLDVLDKMCFDVGVLLNITPDHLDRYKDLDHYVDSKKTQIQRVKQGGLSVVGIDTEYSLKAYEALLKEGYTDIIPISALMPLSFGVYTQNNTVFFAHNHTIETLGEIPSHLAGAHNAQNVMAAYLVARYFNISSAAFFEYLKTFKGLSHRQEVILDLPKAKFINDSKATNAQAALPALLTFQNIYWIAGGLPKKEGITPLLNHLHAVKKVFLIGTASQQFFETLQGFQGPVTQHESLENALLEIKRHIQAEKEKVTVLLSPACASQDQFIDYADRGNQFKQWVLSNFQVQDI